MWPASAPASADTAASRFCCRRGSWSASQPLGGGGVKTRHVPVLPNSAAVGRFSSVAPKRRSHVDVSEGCCMYGLYGVWCMVLYGCMLIQRCMVLYGVVWLYGARREAGQCVAPVWSAIQRNTAEYSKNPYSPPYSHTVARRLMSQAIPLAEPFKEAQADFQAHTSVCM